MLRRVLLIATFACFAQAQEYRSTLTGRITDPSGSGVPSVNVTATKIDTNSHFPTVSGPERFDTIPRLPPGVYELAAEAPGFKKYVQSRIELASTSRVGVDVVLTLGASSESITITARKTTPATTSAP